MKSELVDEFDFSEITYPCLMVYDDIEKDSKLVVLFSKERCGTVVSSRKSVHGVGGYIESWTMNYFKPFNGTVKLTN